jgi:hypothetical protein
LKELEHRVLQAKRCVRSSLIVFAATAALVSGPAGGQTLNQSSRPLPEVRATAAPANAAADRALWSRAADAPAGDADLLAAGDGVVAFSTGGRVCGYRESDGRVRWCAGPGVAPVYASGEVVFQNADGSVRAVDAGSGAERWHDRRTGLVSVWGAGRDVLVARLDASRPGESTYREVDGAGNPLWETRFTGSLQRPVLAFPYAIQGFVQSGGMIVIYEDVLLLGRGGGPRTHLGSALAIAGVESPLAVLSSGGGAEMDDHFLTFDVRVTDMRDGTTKTRLHFAPDYDANAAYLRDHHAEIAGQSEAAASVREENGWIYGLVVNKLYRYWLDGGQRQRPDLIAGASRLLGGPYRGRLYVARPDGVWALRPERDVVSAQLVAPSTAKVSAFAIARDVAYVGFADGHIRGVAVEGGASLLDARSCVPDRIGASALRVYVVCGTGRTRTVTAFTAKAPRR